MAHRSSHPVMRWGAAPVGSLATVLAASTPFPRVSAPVSGRDLADGDATADVSVGEPWWAAGAEPSIERLMVLIDANRAVNAGLAALATAIDAVDVDGPAV